MITSHIKQRTPSRSHTFRKFPEGLRTQSHEDRPPPFFHAVASVECTLVILFSRTLGGFSWALIEELSFSYQNTETLLF